MADWGRLDLRHSFNSRLTLSILLVAFSQFNFGFDHQGYSSAQAMDSFAKQFGSYNEKSKTYALSATWVSFFNGFIYIGQAFGVIIGSWISRRFGRRMCVFVMSIWALVCATIAITATTSDQIMIARVFNFVYIGMELAVVPVYQAEMAPPQARGFIVGTYQTSLYLGGLIINCVALGTGSMTGSKAYRIIFGLFYIVPAIVASLIWFLPESPRWLVLQDRLEDAHKSLKSLREGKYTEEQIDEELKMIVAGTQQESEQGTFLDIFRKDQLRRTLVVIGANFFMQASGQQFTSNYGALFVSSLHTIDPFIVTVVTALINVVISVLANVLTDILGRRPQLLVGTVIQVGSLMAMGGLGTGASLTKSDKTGIVATMIIMNVGYSLGWAPTMHILSAELPSNKSRDMTYRTASIINIVTQFAVSFSLPYLLDAPYADLQSKVGFIFGSITTVSIIFIWFCIPDVAGRSLEEIDELFASGTPLRKFRGTQVEVCNGTLKDNTDTVDIVGKIDHV